MVTGYIITGGNTNQSSHYFSLTTDAKCRLSFDLESRRNFLNYNLMHPSKRQLHALNGVFFDRQFLFSSIVFYP